MTRVLTIVAALLMAAIAAGGAPAAQQKQAFPEVIQLPPGFQPEGIEVGKGNTFYVGSVANGAIYRGNLRTGDGAVIVPGVTGKAATGIDARQPSRLWSPAPAPARRTSTTPRAARAVAGRITLRAVATRSSTTSS